MLQYKMGIWWVAFDGMTHEADSSFSSIATSKDLRLSSWVFFLCPPEESGREYKRYFTVLDLEVVFITSIYKAPSTSREARKGAYEWKEMNLLNNQPVSLMHGFQTNRLYLKIS